MLSWEQLKESCHSCTGCGLCETRHNVVFGVGRVKYYQFLTEIGWPPFLINSSALLSDGSNYNYNSLHSEKSV